MTNGRNLVCSVRPPSPLEAMIPDRCGQECGGVCLEPQGRHPHVGLQNGEGAGGVAMGDDQGREGVESRGNKARGNVE
jgi:hypothetical protein